jgi:hypothetical protein
MPRRLAALLIALIATVSITGTALGSPRDVINDFLDNGSIDVCHPKADYDGARTESVDSQYGDFQGALDQALANTDLVGTDAAPCPAAAAPGENDSGGVSVALIAIPIALAFVALAMVLGGKRRRAGESSDDKDGVDPPA